MNEQLDWAMHMAALYEEQAAKQKCTASYIWRPRLYMDGNSWCALYGENLQDGCCGFGDTPKQAMEDFDKKWGGNYD